MFRRFKRAGDLVATLSEAEDIKHEVMARTERITTAVLQPPAEHDVNVVQEMCSMLDWLKGRLDEVS